MWLSLSIWNFESEKVPLLYAEVAALKGHLLGLQKIHSINEKKRVLMTKLLECANTTKRQIGALQVQLSILKKEEYVANSNNAPFFNTALREARDEQNPACASIRLFESLFS